MPVNGVGPTLPLSQVKGQQVDEANRGQNIEDGEDFAEKGHDVFSPREGGQAAEELLTVPL
jgi:hypothetical protein